MATYIKPNAIKDASIEGIKIKDGTISSSKIDGTVASKSYVDTELDRCAKLGETNTFIQNQYFASGITFNRTSSGGPRFIDIDNKTIRAVLTGNDNSFANIEAAPGYTSPNSVLTVQSLSYPLTIGGSWTFNNYLTAPGINFSSYIGSYASLSEETSYIRFYGRTGNNEVAINGITKVLDDNTSVTNKEYVDTQVKLANNAVQITYSELKSLRDAGKLVPGTQYRITDYTCTTTEAKTRSAGHVFDIIVTADDESTLNEVARAIKHEGDTYFANSDLNAWKIWYCLDNDTERFAWADGTNGRGVIYRMIDEFNNDCPYDFKNIQFTRYKITSSTVSDLVGKYATSDAYNVTVDNSTPYWCYTFSTDSLEDVSLDGYSQMVYNNIIPKFHYGLSILNNIVFIGSGNMGNRFGVLCSNSTFGNNCYGNIFGNDCSRNTFGGECKNNTFGNGFSVNTFGGNCSYNTFGNGCDSNTFGGNCQQNTFGNNFRENTFGSSYGSNTFGNDCSYNTFGDNCSYNTFGNHCQHNTFGNNIQESQFGDGVQYFSITNGLLTIGPEASDVKSFIRWLIVENGVRYVNAYVTSSTSSSSYCQNVRICLGVQGEEVDNRKTFDITSCINSELNNVYQPSNSKTTSV